jgi:predicted outer membrane repeat protein
MIGGNVTFNNPIGMTGASADEYGGAIACLSNAICAIYGTTATAVTISGNSALGKIGIGLGGAIYSEKSVVRIRNVAFSGNNAFYGGGAIALLNGADLECYECSFTGNNAAVATGGALNIYGSVVKFFGVSSFSNNNAKGNGGAIYLSDNGGFENGNPYAIGKLTLNGDVTGKINTAGDSGGFLFAVSADLTLSTSKLSISECTAEKYGGAFSFELDSNVVATSPIALSSNSAKIAGGNFYAVTGAKFTTTSTVTLSSGYAGESGGNLAIMGNVGTGRASFLGAVTMTSGTVASNDIGGITTYSGCNAYFSNAVANFTGGVTFQEGCSANTLPTRSGGEISVIGVSQVRLTNPKFIWSTSITVGTANRAIFGGSIYTSLAAGANFVMTGSSTADCIVQTHPGGPDTFGNAIYIGQGGGNVLISSCTLNGPAPTTNVKEGGTAFFGGSTSLIQNSIIQGGRAKNGGCLYVDANVAIVSTKIEKCVATDYGGALYIYNPNHIVSCSGCTIGSGTAGIEAGIEGGAIYANPNVGGLSLTSSWFLKFTHYRL